MLCIPRIADCGGLKYVLKDIGGYPLDMAKDALSLFVFDMTEDKLEIPKASDPSSIKPEKGFITLIEFDLLEYKKKYDNKAVKKTLTIPNWLNNLADENNINFSQTLQEALKEKLNI